MSGPQVSASFGDDEEDANQVLRKAFGLSDERKSKPGSDDELTLMARGVFLKYFKLLTAKRGDTEALDAIREQMRSDEELIECSVQLIEIVPKSLNWVNSIMKVEAKAVARQTAEMRERVKREKEEAIEAEKRAEREAMMADPGFGLF